MEITQSVAWLHSRALTLALRNLERNGLISRTVYPEAPPRVVYASTPLVDGLAEPLAALAEWAEQRRPAIARRAYDNRPAAPPR